MNEMYIKVDPTVGHKIILLSGSDPLKVAVDGVVIDSEMVLDAIAFRYLADEADPSEFVRLCAGRTGLAVWREVIGAMMENGK